MNQRADKILYNGQIYKSDSELGYADAVAISGDKFLCVGTLEDCEVFRDEFTEMKDLGGRLVLPGLIDGHTHPSMIARSRWRVQLPEFDDMHELLAYVKQYCEEHSREELPFFFGETYPSTMFDKNGPKKEWLDEYVSDRPVKLADFTDHACWYNSKALELLGIDASVEESEDVPIFVRDENNEPTGWVLEPIMSKEDIDEPLYKNLGWYPPTEVTEETIMPFLDFLNDYGVIAVYDGITDGDSAIKLYHDMDKAGKLHLYYDSMCLLENMSELEDCIASIKRWQALYSSKHVSAHTMKIFLDGTNEMGNSASLEAHYNDPTGTNYGEINFSKEELVKILLRLNEEKIDLHVHVVCDRGFRVACDAYEEAKAMTAAAGTAWNIFMELAHCELVHPDDMARPAELGIIINWSCHWAGGFFGEAAIEYLGQERWNTMYDMTRFVESGAVVTYGSDVISVDEESRANPYFGMQVSATRVDPEYPLDPEKYAGSVRPPTHAKLSIEEMIKGYTRYGAIPLRLEDRIGSIETGKQANLVVLDKNIFRIPLEEIHTIRPEAVMFEGEFIR